MLSCPWALFESRFRMIFPQYLQLKMHTFEFFWVSIISLFTV